MTDLFTKKSRWFDFANEHNKKTISGAILLNGSKSYHLVATYLAAGKSIPLSILLDTKRTKGVADHFNGLRQAYETGVGRQHLTNIVDDCRKFATENSRLDSDEMINKIINWTERSGNRTVVVGKTTSLRPSNQQQDNNHLPTKEEFVSAYRTLTHSGESISIDVVLDQIEINSKDKGLSLKIDWRMITEKNIAVWSVEKL